VSGASRCGKSKLRIRCIRYGWVVRQSAAGECDSCFANRCPPPNPNGSLTMSLRPAGRAAISPDSGALARLLCAAASACDRRVAAKDPATRLVECLFCVLARTWIPCMPPSVAISTAQTSSYIEATCHCAFGRTEACQRLPRTGSHGSAAALAAEQRSR
jgi:hypothetical protein